MKTAYVLDILNVFVGARLCWQLSTGNMATPQMCGFSKFDSRL